jgi:hypothetical protein
MKTMLALLALLPFAQDDFSARFKAARPTDDQLRFYSFDWAKDLADAKVRAAKEKRPIFFIAVTNISGPDIFFTGHC